MKKTQLMINSITQERTDRTNIAIGYLESIGVPINEWEIEAISEVLNDMVHLIYDIRFDSYKLRIKITVYLVEDRAEYRVFRADRIYKSFQELLIDCYRSHWGNMRGTSLDDL